MCFVWISEQTTVSAPHNNNRLVLIIEEECLQRGTDWVIRKTDTFHFESSVFRHNSKYQNARLKTLDAKSSHIVITSTGNTVGTTLQATEDRNKQIIFLPNSPSLPSFDSECNHVFWRSFGTYCTVALFDPRLLTIFVSASRPGWVRRRTEWGEEGMRIWEGRAVCGSGGKMGSKS
jgi:hypothetical protein